METNEQLPEYDFDESEDDEGYSNCPKCGHEYDEIDFEYQICHICKHNVSNPNR